MTVLLSPESGSIAILMFLCSRCRYLFLFRSHFGCTIPDLGKDNMAKGAPYQCNGSVRSLKTQM
eukprot:138981-Amphidinium_carterae.1